MKNHTYIISVCALLGLTCATTLASDVAVQPRPSHTPAPSPGLCLNAPAESSLQALETHTLGAAHAAEHAGARAEQCYAWSRRALLQKRFKTWLQPLHVAALGAHIDRLMLASRANIETWGAKLHTLLGTFIDPAHAAAAPEQVGQWSEPYPLPLVGIHAVLLPTGKVLFFTYKNYAANFGATAYVWDPLTRTGHTVDPPDNVWCGGQTLLANGTVLTTGGTLAYPTTTSYFKGLNQVYTFNPFNETWTRQPDMRQGRWYPTVTELADGRALIMGGINESGQRTKNTDVEVFTPAVDPDGVGRLALVGTRNISGYYPHQFLMPNGQVLLAGQGPADTAQLNPLTWAWTDIPNLLQARLGYGSGVLLPGTPSGSNRVMLIGGVTGSGTVLATTEMFDFANRAAGWRFQASLPQPRHNLNTVILPDGNLLSIGGNSNGSGGFDSNTYHYADPQRETELYNPATNTWNPMASQTESRAYHSTALLLPDARVMSAGDDGPGGGGSQSDTVEIYSPPYLFRGARPVLSDAPDTLTWGQTFTLETPDAITQAVLIAPGATTHGNDMHQRYVPLTITASENGIIAKAPPSPNVAPPGYYMLFVLNSQGVPSVAQWVRLDGSVLQFGAGAYKVSEDAGMATLTVTRSGNASPAVAVDYASANGSALEGSDYTGVSGTLHFAQGDVDPKTISVPIIQDSTLEPNETITLRLSNPDDATLGAPDTATLTLLNDDTALRFSAAKYNVNEGAGSAVITVTRTGSKTSAVSVNYTTADGTAKAGLDYGALSGTIYFAARDAAPKTFSVPVTNDTLVEPNETLKLVLSNPTGNAALAWPSTALLSIVNDD